MKTTSTLALSSLLLLASAACSSTNDATSAPSNDAGASSSSDATDAAITAPTWTTNVLAAFDPAAGQLPEGVTIHDGFAYAGFAPLGEIAKVDLASGTSTTFANIPKPVAGKGFMTGLTFGPDGMLYAALVSFDPSVQPGIYRIPQTGGQGALFAKDANMVFPNGLVFDAAGTLFVTDSAAGAIYAIDKSGAVTPWATSDLLVGDQTACGGSGNGFDIGANGLIALGGAFYAINTDKGSLIRFAIQPDGSTAAPALAAGPDCATFSGADGVIADKDGNMFLAINRQNKIIRLAKDGSIALVASSAAVDFPASLDWNGATLIASAFAFANASSGKPAHPALLTMTPSP